MSWEQSAIRLKINELRDTIASKKLELHLLESQLKGLQEICDHEDREYYYPYSDDASSSWKCNTCGVYCANTDS